MFGYIARAQEYDGYNLLDYVQEALSRGRSCWNEPEFLTRIIFTDMIRKNLDGTVDYGIGTARAPSI